MNRDSDLLSPCRETTPDAADTGIVLLRRTGPRAWVSCLLVLAACAAVIAVILSPTPIAPIRAILVLLGGGIALAIAIWGFALRHQVARGEIIADGLMFDISGEVRAKSALARSERRYAALIDAADDAILVLSGQEIVNCNIMAHRLFGCVAVHRPCGNGRCRLADGEPLPGQIAEAFLRGKLRFEISHRTADGVIRQLEVQLSLVEDDSPPLVLAVMRDITARKRLEGERQWIEERLREVRQLETMGRLAGGVAHHFNNLLGAMLGFSQFIFEDSEPGQPIHRYASRILDAGHRGKSLVEQILICAGDVTIKPSGFRLNDMVTAIDWTVIDSLSTDFPVSLDLRDDRVMVNADRPLLKQVLLHLVANAITAQAGGAGTVSLTVCPTEFQGEARARLMHRSAAGIISPIEIWTDEDGVTWAVSGSLPSEPTVSVIVADTGIGMDAAVLEQAFTPFFTTAPPGSVKGLGLTVVHAVVLAHDWAMVVHTRSMEGTTVEIILSSYTDIE